jgi:hypothetical protein
LLQPHYNTLKGGRQGKKEFFHSQQTKDRLRDLAKGRVKSPKTKLLISASTSLLEIKTHSLVLNILNLL